jgi:hypothetical protein
MEEDMHQAKWPLVALVSVAALPVLAETLPQLALGEAIAIMPDGHLGRVVVTDAAAMAEWMKTAKPIPWCAMLLRGEDGNVYLVDTNTHNPMVACENMAPSQ